MQNSHDTGLHQKEKVHEVGNFTFLNRQKNNLYEKFGLNQIAILNKYKYCLRLTREKYFIKKRNSIKNGIKLEYVCRSTNVLN
jgi:hypothetical protein